MKYGARDENYDENNITAENKNDDSVLYLERDICSFFVLFSLFVGAFPFFFVLFLLFYCFRPAQGSVRRSGGEGQKNNQHAQHRCSV